MDDQLLLRAASCPVRTTRGRTNNKTWTTKKKKLATFTVRTTTTKKDDNHLESMSHAPIPHPIQSNTFDENNENSDDNSSDRSGKKHVSFQDNAAPEVMSDKMNGLKALDSVHSAAVQCNNENTVKNQKYAEIDGKDATLKVLTDKLNKLQIAKEANEPTNASQVAASKRRSARAAATEMVRSPLAVRRWERARRPPMQYACDDWSTK